MPPALVNYWSQERASRPQFRLAVAAPVEPRVLRQEVRVTPPLERLAVAVNRPLDSSPSRIEVHDGRKLAEFEVQVLWHDRPAAAVFIPLHKFAGRRVTLEIVQHGLDRQSLVTWGPAGADR